MFARVEMMQFVTLRTKRKRLKKPFAGGQVRRELIRTNLQNLIAKQQLTRSNAAMTAPLG